MHTNNSSLGLLVFLFRPRFDFNLPAAKAKLGSTNRLTKYGMVIPFIGRYVTISAKLFITFHTTIIMLR